MDEDMINIQMWSSKVNSWLNELPKQKEYLLKPSSK